MHDVSPIIRRAIQDDIPNLIQLYIEFHEFHVAGVPDRLRIPEAYDEAHLHNALQTILSSEDSVILVAEVNGKLLGLAEVYMREDKAEPLRVAYRYGFLQSLLVSAQYRKSSLGKELVLAAQQWAKEHGATEMQLDIWEFGEGPLHFYERLGYRTLKRHMVADL
ncbi:MAG TPA: GNAT family N-acetyltransferase [Ktedonobacteraceae bacterium]|jgi:GNAT superfamily N-acetyltransferase|nr:GNAT family N-acetyltransferase [Ktedonobacteraceae bacterium]